MKKQFTREELIKMYFDYLDGPLQFLPYEITEMMESAEVADKLFLGKPSSRRKITTDEANALPNNLLFIAKQLLSTLKTSAKMTPEFAFFSVEMLETMIASYESFVNNYENGVSISDLEDEAAAKLLNAKFNITRQLIELL